jgi:putative tryptophan/tyrosine transport system substrate-binding protein
LLSLLQMRGVMRRRNFILTLAGAALPSPFAARAQQAALPVIGFLGSDTPALYVDRLQAFRAGLKEMGYVEGENVAIDYRWAEGANERLPGLAADLVSRRVAVIATSTTPAAVALKAATSTIPIVFFVASDPVAIGLVASLNRPGGNLTGVTTSSAESAPKWLELLHEMVPSVGRFALLVNPTSTALAEAQTNALQSAARKLGLEVELLHASSDDGLDSAFTRLGELRVGGLVVSSDSFLFTRTDRLAALATRHAMPAIFPFREFPTAGGLMSYGASVRDQHRILGLYAGRILKGEMPAELPVQQTTKLDLVINLKTAHVLGVAVPPLLLARADEVIE